MGLTLSHFGGTLTSNERYFRYGEQSGRSSSSDPDKFLCSKFPIRLSMECPVTHDCTRPQEAKYRP